MNIDLARRTVSDLLSASGKLDEALLVLKQNEELGAFDQCRRLVGQVLGLLYLDVLRGLFATFPELEPAGMSEEAGGRGEDLARPQVQQRSRSARSLVAQAEELLGRLRQFLQEQGDEDATRISDVLSSVDPLTSRILAELPGNET